MANLFVWMALFVCSRVNKLFSLTRNAAEADFKLAYLCRLIIPWNTALPSDMPKSMNHEVHRELLTVLQQANAVIAIRTVVLDAKQQIIATMMW